ncbi:histidine phosphatase family protein [Aeromicrobium marinum]
MVRHGETEWSRDGRHTSTTDLPLTTEGERQAAAVVPLLAGVEFAQVLTSPRGRARRTAEIAGYGGATVDDDLSEWRYGAYEGITTAVIRETDPTWTVWEGPTPGGESPAEVEARLDRVVRRVRAADGPTLVFAHGHSLRVLAARWLGLPAAHGRHLFLDTATVSTLGDDRGTPVVATWNVAVGR